MSQPSGLPVYDTVREDQLYKHFVSSDEDVAKHAIDEVCKKLSIFEPNVAHKECAKLRKFCDAVGIEFAHYTLNIDNLMEQCGEKVVHLHGCIEDADSLYALRQYPAIQMDGLNWGTGDILVVIGVSDNGHPLPYLESVVTANGGSVYYFNRVNRPELVGQQVIGDVAQTFTAMFVSQLVPIRFDPVDYGAYIVHVSYFKLGDRLYEIYFTPTLSFYTSSDEVALIKDVTNFDLNSYSFEVKFDLSVNRLRSLGSFSRPADNFTLQELNLLALVVARIILAHSETFDGDLYTASAAYAKLVKFYTKLATSYAAKLNYECWCAFGPEGANYVFKISK